MRKAAPEGRQWCLDCGKYRAAKFFKDGKVIRCRKCTTIHNREARVLRVYGITPERYEEIKALQGGKCAICQRATGASKALAVDHDHACCPGPTSCGKCGRGLLCSVCNKMLGHARDEPEFFRRAADYLQFPPAKWGAVPVVPRPRMPISSAAK